MTKVRKAPVKTPQKKTLNPFEIHINKQKMTVLGQKNKNDRGLPGVSRAKALKKRKETLLKEYKLQNKSNRFMDRRIGEGNREMSSDDKIMARFTAIRKKAHKKSIFNLADDEVLTHKGQTLAEIEKFDDPRSDDDDDEDEGKSGNLDSNFVEDAHFGGGILKNTGREGAKTHKELIQQLIEESKKRKAEKQKTKEATLELTEKLDSEWKDLLPLVNKKNDKKNEEKVEVDHYDRIMRELKFEARGGVSDRLKSDEEIAKEEKERLDEMEEERDKRMKWSEEEDKRTKHRSADDLDDDVVYESDEEYMLSYNKEGEANVEIEAQLDGKKISEKKNEEKSNNEEDDDAASGEEESEDEEEESEDEEEEEDDDLSDLKAETSEESGDEDPIPKKKLKIDSETQEEPEIKEMEEILPDLPLTFSIPDSYENFEKLLENKPYKHQSIILDRMIKSNHPSLSENNKKQLQLLFAYQLQYLNNCATSTSCFKILEILAPHIFDLAQLDQENIHSIKELIKEKFEDYRKHKKNYPGVEMLIFLKVISLLFSTSDFRHPIVTPSFVFIEQMLWKCRVNSRRDIAYGLFLVTLVLEYTSLSKRYFPAAVNYLGGILHMAIPKLGVKLIKVKPPFQSIGNSLVLVNNCSENVDLKMEINDLFEEKIDDSFRIRAIYTSLKLIEEFDSNFELLSSNVEIFKDIAVYLELLPTRNYPKNVQIEFDKISQQLKNKNSQREYIVMAAKRPKALRLYEPKIVPIFDGKRRKVQSKEKTERDKLLHKLKKETKGAMREIRRDKAFLGRVKVHQRIKSDQERNDKVRKIYAEAAMQQHELNSLDRKNKKTKLNSC